MKPLPRTLLFLVLLSAGILAGRALSSSDESNSSTAEPTETTTNRRPPREIQREAPRTFASLTARVKEETTPPKTLRTELARVSTDTLKNIVLEQYAILAEMTEGGKTRQPHQDLYTAAMEELWGRQKLSTFEWAATLEAPKERAMMQKSLLYRALAEDLEGALPWMEKYHAENGKAQTYGEFKSIAIKGAVERGADAVIRAFEAFPEAGAYSAFGNVEFPEDFDFAKLHQAVAGKVGMNNIFAQWTLRDRDAAWAAMEEGIRTIKGRPADEIGEGMMKAVMVKDGEPAGVTWVLEKLAALPNPDTMRQDQILSGIITHSDLSTEGIGMVSAKLTPEGRMNLAVNALTSRSAQSGTGHFLATLPRNELIQALRETSNRQFYSDSTYVEQLNRFHGELYKRFQLTPAEMEEIKGAAGTQ